MRRLILLLCALTLPGIAIAGIAEGKAAYEKKHYKVALKEFRKLAEQGDPEAQAYLGNMYLNGNGVKSDYLTAIEWFKKSADHGNSNGQLYLGIAYRDGGMGVPRDCAAAMALFHKAADQGNSDAQVAIGGLYEEGCGVPQNGIDALFWYDKAAEQGNEVAQFVLGIKYGYTYRAYNDKAIIWAYKWLNIVAATSKWQQKDAAKMRDDLASTMSAIEIAEAQRLSREWMEAHPKKSP